MGIEYWISVLLHFFWVTYRYTLLSSQPRQLPAPETFTSLACWQDLGDSSTFPSRAPSLTLVDRKTLWMKCSAHCNWDVPATCQRQIAKAGEPWPVSLHTLHAWWDPNADLNNGNLNCCHWLDCCRWCVQTPIFTLLNNFLKRSHVLCVKIWSILATYRYSV